MKTLRSTLLFLSIFICVNAHSDIVITDLTPRVKFFVSLQNPDKFPGYKIIGLTQIMIDNAQPKPFIIEKGQYYQSHFIQKVSFVAVKESYLNGKNLNAINWHNDKNVIRTDLLFTPADQEFSNYVENMKIGYTIVGITDTSMILHRSSEVFQFRDKNKADSICQYEYKGEPIGLSKAGR